VCRARLGCQRQHTQARRWFHHDDSYVQPLAGLSEVVGRCERDGYLFFYTNDAISSPSCD
jgi:hypothetical protein